MSEFRSMRMSVSDSSSLSLNQNNDNNICTITKSIVSQKNSNIVSISTSSGSNTKQSTALHDSCTSGSIQTKQSTTSPPHSIHLKKCGQDTPPQHSFQFPKKNLSIVLERIYDVLRRASVQVVSRPDPTASPFSSSIVCRSMNRVAFSISLWEEGNDNNSNDHVNNTDNNNDIVLEMTPCNGDRLMYYKHYAKLVRSATILTTDLDTLNYDPETSVGYKSCRSFCPNASERTCPFANLSYQFDDPGAMLLSAIEIAASLLQNDRLDAQILGLESVLFLLDENKMQSNTDFPRDVSRGILLNHDTKPWTALHDGICTLAMRDSIRPKDEKADPFEYEKRYLALSIVSKSLKLLGTNELQDFLSESNDGFPSAAAATPSDCCKAFLDVLAHCLAMVSEDPHVAYQAICILVSLASCQNEYVQKYIYAHADAIAHAHTYGTAFHASLEQESLKLIRMNI